MSTAAAWGPHGDGPGQCPAPGGSASVASWQAPPLDQGGGAGLRERINFLTRIALASPLSSPQRPLGQVWDRGLAHQKPDGRSPSAADHSAGCFCRHRRNEVRDRLGAHDLSGFHRRDRMLPEVRMARIIDAIGLHQARKLSCVEAAELLGMSERHFRRLRDAYEAHGAEGIVDRRRGRASGRRAGVDEIAWVIEEFRTRSFDFTAKHFHEAIQGRAMADGTPFSRGYTWTKSVLQVRGLVSKAPKRSAHRKKRARRPRGER